MAPLLLAALVTLSWFVPTTRAIVCDAGRRYVHPHNCSAFIMCNKNSSPEIFKCPTGLHYSAMKSYCDWPENAKCTLEEKRETALVNSTRNITADIEKIVVQKTKGNGKVRYITMKNKEAAIQRGESGNKTTVVQPGVLNKSQPKEAQHNESKKEIKGGNAKTKTTNNGAKEGGTKISIKEKTEEINSSDALTNSGTSENKGNLEVKSRKVKTEEKVSSQEKTSERDSAVNKSGFFSKAFHSISKREDQTDIKQEETKKTREKKNEGDNGMKNKKLSGKSLEVEIEKANLTKVENVTSEERLSYGEKELDFSNKSFIDIFMKTNNTGDNLNNKEVSEKPVINNSGEVPYFTVPFNFNSMQETFGYEVMPIGTKNSTSDGSLDIESPPTSENVPKIENEPTSESSSTSVGTSKSESKPTSKSVPRSTPEPSVGKKIAT